MIVGSYAPDFTAESYFNGQSATIRLSDYRGKWVLLFFYSGDFSFV